MYISINYIKSGYIATVLCTVHFGFVSLFFCSFVEGWTLYLHSTALCLSYHCFIVLLLFGLIIALFGLKRKTFISLFGFVSHFFFLFLFLLNIYISWYIYYYIDKTNFTIFSQLLTCANTLKHCNYRGLVSWATFFFQVLNSNYSAKWHSYIYCYIDTTTFTIFSQLLTCKFVTSRNKIIKYEIIINHN